jgi:hypothetical protein
MNRDHFLQRVQRTSSSDAHESDEPASASRQNHRQQAQQSDDRLNEELAHLANLYSAHDLVNRGAQ